MHIYTRKGGGEPGLHLICLFCEYDSKMAFSPTRCSMSPGVAILKDLFNIDIFILSSV